MTQQPSSVTQLLNFVVASEEPTRPITRDDQVMIAREGVQTWLGALSTQPVIEYNVTMPELAEQWIYAYLSELLDIGFQDPPKINARCGQVFLVDVIPQVLTIRKAQQAQIRRAYDPPIPIFIPQVNKPRMGSYQRSYQAYHGAIVSLGNALRQANFNNYDGWLKGTSNTLTEVVIGMLNSAGEAMAMSVWWGTLRAEIRKLRDMAGITV